MDSIEKNVNFDIHKLRDVKISVIFDKIWEIWNNYK